MARCLTVLVALVAQGMALMSPVCFVRCVSANGHECVELSGQGCQRCDCQERESLPQVCSVAKCCEQCHNHDDEQETPEGPQIAGQPCSCHHSPLELAPQVQAKSLISGGQSQVFNVVTLPAMLDFVSIVRALENVSLQPSPSRPHESPHLAVMATVVLRV
ncbi:MAG: hypothetical protein IAG10_18000 [Planctomycetaceae bacterium]|nr:hypothetical protein [Planctomycetaceae bacterium]